MSSSRRGPDFIIIGAMKCATSTLHQQLAAHKSFFMTVPKEPNFFSDNEVYGKGIQWYESLFDQAKPNQIKGESSTHYSKLPILPNTLKRMSAHYPEIKCIYIMRHPVDRLISHYIHEWTMGVIACDIDLAVEQFPELIEYSRYSYQLQPYFDTFGYPSILPVFVERLKENPQRELQDIFNFLEVPEPPAWHEDIRSNVSSDRLRVCSWRDALVRNPVCTVLRRSLVPKAIRRRIRKIWTMENRPNLSDCTLQKVKKIFNDDLEELSHNIGIDLNCDNFKQQITSPEKVTWV